MAASIEQNHDDRGIIWPTAIAPYEVAVIPVNGSAPEQMEIATELYRELLANQVEGILDDTDERAGVKFANADLIGYPLKAVIGKKTVSEGTIDIKVRATGEEHTVALKDALQKIIGLLRQ